MNSKSVNAQNVYGWTALHAAISNQSEIAVKELLERDDVNVNLKNDDNQTALHLATMWKDIPMYLYKVILEKSTDVNAKNENGNTALHVAILLENKTAVKELLKREDVDMTLKNNNNQTALNLCSKWKDIPANLLKIINEKTFCAIILCFFILLLFFVCHL
jgi:ankyrin repeat protein